MSNALRRLPAAAVVLLACLAIATVAQAGGLDAKEWSKAKSALEAAVSAKDAAAVAASSREVARDDSSRAAKLLTSAAVASAGTGAHEDVAAAIATFTDDKARAFIIKNAEKHKDRRVRWLFVMALAQANWPEGKDALLGAMNGRDEGLALAALEGFAERRTLESIEMLIAFLEKRDQENPPKEIGAFGDPVRRKAIRTLQDLTGEDLEDGVDWRNWMDLHGAEWSAEGAAEKKKEREKEGGNKIGGTVVDRMKENRPDAYRTLEGLEKDDIIVVTGVFDQCQDVLRALGLPYTLVQRTDFAAFPLNPKQIVIFNCDEQTGKLSPEGQQRLREFTARGGYVFTSDWELQNVVAPSFPKTISMAGSTGELHVGITPAKGAESHPLLRDVFPADPFKAASFKWKIDGASFTVRPGGQSQVLVHSDELASTHGSGIVAIVTRFGAPAGGKRRRPSRPTTGGSRYGGSTTGDDGSYVEELRGGAILHVLSHFYSQKDEGGDGFALQQMLLNFIVEKQAYRAAEAARKKK